MDARLLVVIQSVRGEGFLLLAGDTWGLSMCLRDGGGMARAVQVYRERTVSPNYNILAALR